MTLETLSLTIDDGVATITLDRPPVNAISMALLAGAMFGRVLGSGRMIVRVLSSAVWDRT